MTFKEYTQKVNRLKSLIRDMKKDYQDNEESGYNQHNESQAINHLQKISTLQSQLEFLEATIK